MKEMPTNCNGLVRLDKSLPFCKQNCKWSRVNQGRPPISAVRHPRQITKKRRIKNPKTLCFTIEQKHYDFIQKQALQLSAQKGVIIQPNELIREALIKAYPCPELYDLFGGQRK